MVSVAVSMRTSVGVASYFVLCSVQQVLFKKFNFFLNQFMTYIESIGEKLLKFEELRYKCGLEQGFKEVVELELLGTLKDGQSSD